MMSEVDSWHSIRYSIIKRWCFRITVENVLHLSVVVSK